MGEELNQRTYGDADEGSAITLKSVMHICKLSAVRVAIYLLCAVILAAAVVGVLRLFAPSERVTSTQIELRYTGSDQGLAPDGSPFQKDSIRSASVLNEAIENLGLQNKIPSTDALRDKIFINGVLSNSYLALQEAAASGDAKAVEELRSYTFFPTRFDIKIQNFSDLGLSEDEARALLNAIMDAYRYTFKQSWMIQQYPVDIYTLHTTDSGALLDYINFHTLYKNKLDQVQEGLEQLQEKDSFYRSPTSKKTFSDLIADGMVLLASYERYSAYIWSYGVTKNVDIAIVNLEETIKEAQENLVRLKSNKTSLELQLQTYKPNYVYTIDKTTGEPVREDTYPQEFHDLQMRLADIDEEIANSDHLIAQSQRRLDVYKAGAASTEHEVYVESLLNSISDESIAFVNRVNRTVEDYFDYSIGTQFVQVLQPAASVTVLHLLVPEIYIWLGFILAAIVAGFIVTIIKRSAILSKGNKKETEPTAK